MAEEELQTLEIQDNFYRDGYLKIIAIFVSLLVCIGSVVALSIYLYLTPPPPQTFSVESEWRVHAPVSLDKPYLTTSDLLQWVSEVLPRSFVYDFIYYNDQLKNAMQYFTPNGWKVFLNHLNIYANYNRILTNKMFITATPTSAPYVINQGLLTGRYSWWVQIPLRIQYFGYVGSSPQIITLQVLVVRVPTLNNLDGVAIENILIANATGER